MLSHPQGDYSALGSQPQGVMGFPTCEAEEAEGYQLREIMESATCADREDNLRGNVQILHRDSGIRGQWQTPQEVPGGLTNHWSGPNASYCGGQENPRGQSQLPSITTEADQKSIIQV